MSKGALAQDWPSKAINLVVPFPAGGSNDVVARLVGESARKRLGQAVLVDNKPGANGSLGVETTLRAAKDQHTFLVASDSVSLLPLFRNMPWDLTKTFTPIAVLSFQPIVIVTAPSSGLKTIQDLQTRAKGKPDQVSYASSGQGSIQHLVGELFSQNLGVNLLHIPYKGGGPLAIDGVAGHVPVTMATYALWAPHLASGKLRPLAVTSNKRMAELPDVPTLQELGIAGFEAQAYWGLLGPAGIPASIVNRMNAEVAKALKLPAVQERLVQMGVAITSSSPQEFDRFIRNEIDKWGKVVKDNNIKAGQ